MTTARTVLIIAALTLREASRRRVLAAVAVLTVALLALSGWGFCRLAAESGGSALTSGEARPTASIVLNLLMFGYSLVAALSTAFLAGPTESGESESGVAQDPSALFRFGGESQEAGAFPFLRVAPLTATYVGWAVLWVAMVWGLAAACFVRKDL